MAVTPGVDAGKAEIREFEPKELLPVVLPRLGKHQAPLTVVEEQTLGATRVHVAEALACTPDLVAESLRDDSAIRRIRTVNIQGPTLPLEAVGSESE